MTASKGWAYQPIVRHPLPPFAQQPISHNPIDRWLAARWQQEGITANPVASRQTLIRRLSYDLTGLPPSLADLQRFEEDRAPDAYERLVDRLLASPQYGEKWGRHWLDIVRYAETNGYERDGAKENVWRYRDYVIDAFNRDKPYARFVLEQLAGDELADRNAESLVATAYYRLGLWDDEPVDADQAYYDSLDDVVSTTGLVFLGTTMGCARCHDHKIDPIPQRDYYRMMAFFHNILQDSQQLKFKKTAFQLNTQTIIASVEERTRHEQMRRELDAKLQNLLGAIQQFEGRVFDSFTNPEKEDARDQEVRRRMIEQRAHEVLGDEDFARYEALRAEHAELERAQLPPLPRALTIRENGREPRETFVLVRGNAHAQGDRVEPGFPAVLPQIEPEFESLPDEISSSGQRLAFARWLVHPDNPLTARVIANRLWQHHFGRGLVASSSDFGRQGDAPTHPELLDFLATELVRYDWHIKPIQRMIVLSHAYRLASTDSREALAKDPENHLAWRFPLRRLTAEEIRDSILSISGDLNLAMGGPSVYSVIPDEVLQTASRPDAAWGVSTPAEQSRRSVYVHVKRSVADPVLRGFDAADTDGSCPVRFATTVPTQSLTSLNGLFFQQQATRFAERLRHAAPADLQRQVELGFAWALARPARADEVELGMRLLREWQTEDHVPADDALRYFCLMVLNLNETVFVE